MIQPGQLTESQQFYMQNGVLGYKWLPDRFGPPPGVAKSTKDYLDQLSDRDYLKGISELTPEEVDSLMVSETERRRSFANNWPVEFIDRYELAKQGFYYTGVSGKVQCAFCAGVIENWNVGDVPLEIHKRCFSYCKMAQNKRTNNIPCVDQPVANSIMSHTTDTRVEASGLSNVQKLNVRELDSYKVVISVGLNKDVVEQAFRLNQGDDFCDVQDLISLVQALEAGDPAECNSIISKQKSEKRERKANQTRADQTLAKRFSGEPQRLTETETLIRDNTNEESDYIVQAMTCRVCLSNVVGAVLLPCAHFCICQQCSYNNVPARCPTCKGVVHETCGVRLQ